MKPRKRLLVCGFDPGQGRGEPGYEEERWWVHAATFSAQGPYSIPWWPVPPDTVKGDLFALRLAPFEVPKPLRSEMAERRVALGQGVAGRLLAEATEYSGFGLFGGGLGDRSVDLPLHPEFDPGRTVLGEGLIGLAVAHSAAELMEGDPPFHSALVGTFVPFPDIVPASELMDRCGSALGDLETPMSERPLEQIEISDGDFAALLEVLRVRFSDDVELGDSINRLREVASRLGEAAPYYPVNLGPSARWEFSDQGVGESQVQEVDEDYRSASAAHLLTDLMNHLQRWAGGLRSPGELPEQKLVVDGGDSWSFEPMPPDIPASGTLGLKVGKLLPILGEKGPATSAALFAHEGGLYTLIMSWDKPDEAVVVLLSLGLPQPGDSFGSPEAVDLSGLELSE